MVKKRYEDGRAKVKLTREQLLALEDELIIEYQKDEFQKRLHEIWGAAADDELSKVAARQEACLPVQLPILERYGFERSRKGLAESVYAYSGYPIMDPDNVDFFERSRILTWLVSPAEQWHTPKPYVPLPLWSAMPSSSGSKEAEDGLGSSILSVVARHLSGEVVAAVKLLPRDHIIRIREAVERQSLDGGRCARPFKLVFGGKVLTDSQSAENAGLTDGAELSIVNLPPFQVLTASGDRTARLYDGATGETLQAFSGHGATVRSAAFSPDGFRVVTASKDRTARIWNPATGTCEVTLEGHSNSVNKAVFSNDGMYVATASDDSIVKIFDAATGKCEKNFYCGGDTVNGVVFSPDGRFLLLALGDNSAKILNPVTGQDVQTFWGHGSFVNSAVFSPDGLKVATTSDDRTARLFDTTTGECNHVFTGHRKAVNSAEFSADGRQLLTSSDDCNVLLHETAMAACRRKFEHQRSVNHAVFSPDGRHVLTACDDRRARLFHAVSGELVLELLGHQGAVYRATFGIA
mmetsp:Transcript_98165/g.302662  ORF Transcript_98165/g.302662 Transcript_98165/m.302662 type:complete len:522 (+) Transcript_98165:54-1619(+)